MPSYCRISLSTVLSKCSSDLQSDGRAFLSVHAKEPLHDKSSEEKTQELHTCYSYYCPFCFDIIFLKISSLTNDVIDSILSH